MDKEEKGFTLIELLVVISIISLLSSVVFSTILTARAKSRDAKKISDLKQIQNAVELYFDEHGYYPYTVDCPEVNSGWVSDNGGVDYTPNGIVLLWSDLETELSPYLDLPKTPGKGSYRYGATKKDYAIQVSLEQNNDLMINDGGCYPVLGTGCTSYMYEVHSGLRGTSGRWTCQSHMCTGF